jgi:hypothetical protein
MILVRLCTLWWAVVVGFAALFALRLRFKSALVDSPTSDAEAVRIG